MRRSLMLILLAVSVFACDTEAPVTTETTTTAPPVELTTTTVPLVGPGSPTQPIQIVFPPDASPDLVLARSQPLLDELTMATGLNFEARVASSYSNAIDLVCGTGGDTFVFLTAEAYALAAEKCEVTIPFRAIIDGADSYRTVFYYRRDDDDDIEKIGDLSEKIWAHPGETSQAGYVLPKAILVEEEVEVGEILVQTSEEAVIRAVYDEKADFGTTTFVLNTDLEGEIDWDGTASDADVPKRLWESCKVDESDRYVCGEEVLVLDPRGSVGADHEDVVAKIGILSVSDPILFGGIVFAPNWPEDTLSEVQTALNGFFTGDSDSFVEVFGSYGWEQMVAAEAGDYDPVRRMVTALGLTPADLG